MGGISVMVMLAAMGAFVLVFFVALALFVAATVVSIVFAARTKQRRERGKKLGALVAIPIALYVVSVPVLIFFAAGVFAPAFHAGVTTTYEDCAHAVTTHEPDRLEDLLEAPELQLPDEGQQSYRSLLRVAIKYGDEECARTILEDAEADGSSIDLTRPLDAYDVDGNLTGADYALCLATAESFSSLEMVQLLIEFGANVNSADDEGFTPLHNACSDLCTTAIASDTSSASLDETDEATDLLLQAGADPSAENDEGKTPWDLYRQTMGRYVDDGVLTKEEAAAHLTERARTLQP